ncbi:MalY/PatB family protein [Ramlibacter tataouinensis]|uniref:MalY/PatB family protein n=1 Tax=Ramlibacter tataouinensis TaxID=94132 RepID=UPI000776EA46|nr:PatB family C-S lyase [Ramlibacter tataouinensis]
MFEFDNVADRLQWSATKWEKYRGRDVIPLWIADMDYPTAPAIQAAVAAHAAHGNYGYMSPPRELAQLLVKDHETRYGWAVQPEWIVWLPGLVLGLNLAVKTCCAPGEGALSFSPIYPPFLTAPGIQGRGLVDVPLRPTDAAGTGFAIDFEALEAAMHAPAAPRLLLLCHPHNPIGRLYTREELGRLAEFCERHDLYVCSDEVHCDLILDPDTPHLPFAKVLAERAPRLLARTITLHGPGKTYNIAGLGIAWAIIPDADLRQRFRASMGRLVPDPCCFGFTALKAAFEHGEPWRLAMLAALRRNRDRVSAALARMGLPHTHPEVSYLTWIDARALAAQVGNPAAWFERHGVGLNDGADFGRPGYLRLNYATPARLLGEALDRMAQALAGLQNPAAPQLATIDALPA